MRGATGEFDFYTLATLELEILGFQLADPAPAALYARRFPKGRTMIDLARWAEIEEEAPNSFARMYQFWCGRL